jgi:hypothetical protein
VLERPLAEEQFQFRVPAGVDLDALFQQTVIDGAYVEVGLARRNTHKFESALLIRCRLQIPSADGDQGLGNRFAGFEVDHSSPQGD